jgi:hypothetical protein
MSKQNEQKEIKEKTYSQSSRLENPEELQLHHTVPTTISFFTVLLLFAQCKMRYW